MNGGGGITGWLRQFTPLFLVVAGIKLALYSLLLALAAAIAWDAASGNAITATAGSLGLFWGAGAALLANIAAMLSWRLAGRQIYRSRYPGLARSTGGAGEAE